MAKRSYLTAVQMRPMYERYKASGQTIKTFCEAAKINHHTFNYWRLQFLKEEGVQGSQIKSQIKSQKPTFHKIETPVRTDSTDSTDKITLRIKENLSLDFPSDYSPALLVQLIQQLSC